MASGRAQRVIDFLCTPYVGFEYTNIRRFLRRAPFVLLYDIDSDMVPAIEWIKHTVIAPHTTPEYYIRGIPQVLGTSVDQLDALHDFLREEVELTENMMRVAVRVFPSMLTFSIDKRLRPALKFLLQDLAISKASIARVVQAFPAVLTLTSIRKCGKMRTFSDRVE